jgi:glutamyl/glutaminyl-tRNA synthetase
VRTRFAPTSSGYLHQGNLANALIIDWLAKSYEGECFLRIDTDDRSRTRIQYVEYITASLHALGLIFLPSPLARDDRIDYLRSQLALLPPDQVFACLCSRTDLLARACTCRTDKLQWTPGINALRLHLDKDLNIEIEGESINLRNHFGDVVLWRREGIPAYHWTNMIDDRDLQITHVVRGRDLLESTALHIYLERLLNPGSTSPRAYLHHQLLTDTTGRKLSKSTQGNSPPESLNPEYLMRIRISAEKLAAALGITPKD